MASRFLLAVAAFAAATVLPSVYLHAAGPLAAVPTTQPTDWTIQYRNQPVLVVAATPQPYKPYVKALHTIKGANVLRDAPHDHLHHHALMYGIRVNDLNFWEETPGCGVQKPVQSPPPEFGTAPDGSPQAVVRQTLHWLAPGDAFLPDTTKVALLVEQRTLTLRVNEAQQEVALHWQSDFTVGAKTNAVTLSGANYHGLGLRFRQELDPLAQHRLAQVVPDLSNNRQDVSAHPWGAVAFDAPHQPATLVLAGHPANARGNSTFFSMRTPFAYLSATQALDKEPLVYTAGQRFRLEYLVLLYPSLPSADAIERRVRAWTASATR